MPRPKVQGPPIQFRLTIEQHELLAARAEAKGVSVNEHVKAGVVKSLEALSAPIIRGETEPIVAGGGSVRRPIVSRPKGGK